MKESSVKLQGRGKATIIITTITTHITNKQLRLRKLIKPNMLLNRNKERNSEYTERCPGHRRRPNSVEIWTGFLCRRFRLFLNAMGRYRGKKSWNESEKKEREDWLWCWDWLRRYSHQTVFKQNVDQWDIIESPKIDSRIYGQLIVNKETKTSELDGLLNKWSWNNCLLMNEKVNLRLNSNHIS